MSSKVFTKGTMGQEWWLLVDYFWGAQAPNQVQFSRAAPWAAGTFGQPTAPQQCLLAIFENYSLAPGRSRGSTFQGAEELGWRYTELWAVGWSVSHGKRWEIRSAQWRVDGVTSSDMQGSNPFSPMDCHRYINHILGWALCPEVVSNKKPTQWHFLWTFCFICFGFFVLLFLYSYLQYVA